MGRDYKLPGKIELLKNIHIVVHLCSTTYGIDKKRKDSLQKLFCRVLINKNQDYFLLSKVWAVIFVGNRRGLGMLVRLQAIFWKICLKNVNLT